MELLSLVASLTKKRVIASEAITTPVGLAPFSFKDSITGKVKVVTETFDPTVPTIGVLVDSAGGVALTDGISQVFATGATQAVTNNNEVNFTLSVDSPTLEEALAAAPADYINAFLELRIVKDSQDIQLLREPCIITNAAVLV